jgi:mono/diheme cytochrome c family protein
MARRQIFWACVAVAAWPGLALAQSAAAGKALFDQDCAICHLASGQGGVRFGDAVSANLTAPGLEALYHHQDALIARAIVQAKDQDGAPLDMPMPAWQGRLTKAEVMEIIAYLHTLKS